MSSKAERVYYSFRESCSCGKTMSNNCAHYLHNAMIVSGVSSKGDRSRLAVCDKDRILKAKTLSEKKFFGSFGRGVIPYRDGFYFCFQTSSSFSGTGHVCVVKVKDKKVVSSRGTSGGYINGWESTFFEGCS